MYVYCENCKYRMHRYELKDKIMIFIYKIKRKFCAPRSQLHCEMCSILLQDLYILDENTSL